MVQSETITNLATGKHMGKAKWRFYNETNEANEQTNVSKPENESPNRNLKAKQSQFEILRLSFIEETLKRTSLSTERCQTLFSLIAKKSG